MYIRERGLLIFIMALVLGLLISAIWWKTIGDGRSLHHVELKPGRLEAVEQTRLDRRNILEVIKDRAFDKFADVVDARSVEGIQKWLKEQRDAATMDISEDSVRMREQLLVDASVRLREKIKGEASVLRELGDELGNLVKRQAGVIRDLASYMRSAESFGEGKVRGFRAPKIFRGISGWAARRHRKKVQKQADLLDELERNEARALELLDRAWEKQ